MTNKKTHNLEKSLSYKDSGVDIDKGNHLVKLIKNSAKSTFRPEVLGGIGGFGSLFKLPNNYKNPVLVSGADGVGTKLKIAIETGMHEGIGIDLVAMCVNDLIVAGAEPLFFLDYYATDNLDITTAKIVIKSIAKGCQISGASLIGGETAEMPGIYTKEKFDLAGFSVGIVSKKKILNKKNVKKNDLILAIPSSGLHSNGFSLVRSILKKNKISKSLKKELIKPTKIYTQEILKLVNKNLISSAAHITGGGLIENIIRSIPNNLSINIDLSKIKTKKIFKWLKSKNISNLEMLRTFNCGVGFCLIINKKNVKKIKKYFTKEFMPYEIGYVSQNIKRINFYNSIKW